MDPNVFVISNDYPFKKMGMSNLQVYHLNLYLINNLEDLVVFHLE